MEAKIKHLQFIQDTINRMAHNSFLLKGWAVTIFAGLTVFAFKEYNSIYLWIVMGVCFIFCLLDGYYLSRERRFVELYNIVRQKEETKIDFSMNTKQFSEKCSFFDSVLSHTILVFYGGLVLVQLLVFNLIC